MRRSHLFMALAALSLALATSAAASASVPVAIEVRTVFNQTEWPFVASGPAVDLGLVCPSGIVTDGKYIAAGRPGGGH